MNIIQIQDRLKGMPRSAIIDYVKNPTGDVPTYLALGELNRRKEADEKFQANQEQPATVAEQIVSENIPQGIGNMIAQSQPAAPTSGIGVPQTQPQEEINPEMLASAGVGALPAGTMELAEGGIIAFDRGGRIEEAERRKRRDRTKYNPRTRTGQALNVTDEGKIQKSLGSVKDKIKQTGSKIKSATSKPGMIDRALVGTGKGIVSGTKKLAGAGLAGLKNNPLATRLGTYGVLGYEGIDAGRDALSYAGIVDTPYERGLKGEEYDMPNPFGITSAINYLTGKSGEMEKLQDQLARNEAMQAEAEESMKKSKAILQAPPVEVTPPPKTEADYRQDFFDALGEDTGRKEMKERMAELDEKTQRREKDAPWMALIDAGLNSAAGSSPFAIQNMAVGLAAGLKSYGAEQEAIQEIEERRLALQDQISTAERAEKVAAIEYGMQSKQAADAAAATAALAEQEYALKLAELNLKQVENMNEQQVEGLKILSDQGILRTIDTQLEENGLVPGMPTYETERTKLINSQLRSLGITPMGGMNDGFDLVT
jgi:hypothetical protein